MTWSIPPQPYIFLKLKPRKMMGKIEFRPESDRTTRTRVTDYFVEYISEIRYAPTCAARHAPTFSLAKNHLNVTYKVFREPGHGSQ